MDLGGFRPVLSGLIGGLIAVGLGIWWRRRQSAKLLRERDKMLDDHIALVYLASFLFFGGIIAGLLLGKFGGFQDNDWRPFGLGVGGGCVAALLALTIIPLMTGRSVKEAYIAFAHSDSVSPVFVYTVMGAGVLGFVWALASLI